MKRKSVFVILFEGGLIVALCSAVWLGGGLPRRGGITPLMASAKKGDVAELQQLIEKGAGLDELSKYSWTALMFAAHGGHEQAVNVLLEAGANPNIESERIAIATIAPTPKTTALAEAIKNQHLSIANTLMDRGAVVDPASVALAGGEEDLSLLKRMHAGGADINQASDVFYYPSALHMASRNGLLENVQWLINQGADPNTALGAAISGDHPTIVQYLIDSGAEPNLVFGAQGSTPLLWAATRQPKPADYDKSLQIINILLAAGADKNYRSEDGYYGNRTAVEFLQDKRAGTVERIEQAPFGEKEQRTDQALLEHRDNIVKLLGE
ncbi:MAG: ankyrin repeat domain-containing protein [Cyanobacteria bacterium P01_F01_bin.53]